MPAEANSIGLHVRKYIKLYMYHHVRHNMYPFLE